ncbi:MAG TPA: hypothetical protein VJL35_03620 [Gemmatimonadaceae bacterium]|nr:hypothetical protein [Gemmatimonadaceae bacterium]
MFYFSRENSQGAAVQAGTNEALALRLVQSGLAIAIAFALTACESDSTVAAGQDSNEDQALALSVMGARGDTLTAAVENEVVVDTSLPPDLRPVAPPPPPAPPALSPAVVQAQVASPVLKLSTRAQPPAPKSATPRIAAEPPRERIVQPVLARAQEEPKEESPRRTGLIARGSTLSVITSRSVCNDAASVGNTVRGQLASSIRGTNGLVIPGGAQVVAEITSVDKWGAGIGLQVTSVHVDGRSYPVRSRTEYVLPQGTSRGACIREGTRLTVETKAPITLSAR